MKKRVLSLLLALMMCLSLLPATAQAAQEEFTYTAPDGLVYGFGTYLNHMVLTRGFMVKGYEGEPTDITIPFSVEGTYINSAGEEVRFNKFVETIGDGAFDNCTSLETVTINGCSVLPNSCFVNCTSLREIDLSKCPASSIGSHFCYGCTNLKTVTLPATLTSLSTGFEHSKNLEDVYFLTATPPKVSNTIHDEFKNAATIFHVPAGSKSSYAYKGDDPLYHAVVEEGETVPYGTDFSLEPSETTFDLGEFYYRDSISKSISFTLLNTASEEIGISSSLSGGSSDASQYISLSIPSSGSYSGAADSARVSYGRYIKPTLRLSASTIFPPEPGTYTASYTITATGLTSRKKISKTITASFTVRDKEETGITLKEPSVIDLGDISAGTSASQLPTYTFTVTSDRVQSTELRLWASDNFLVNGKTGTQYVSIPKDGATFTIKLTDRGIKALADGPVVYNFIVSTGETSGSSGYTLATIPITFKANFSGADRLELDQSEIDLGEVEERWYVDNSKYGGSITLRNTGVHDVTLSKPTSSNFVFSDMIDGYVLHGGEKVTFMIWPKKDLKAGVYEEDIVFGTGAARATLRARFTVTGAMVTASFDSDGGSSVSDKTVIVGQTYGYLPTPTREGYVFDGWYTSSYGGDKVTDSTTVTNTYNHTLYAHWTEADGDDLVIESGVLTKYNGSGGNVVIPDGVTAIGQNAFSGCAGLTGVTIPNSVTTIGQNAFSGTNLTSVTIPSSVTTIGRGAFIQCTGLTSISVSSGNRQYASIDGVLFTSDKKTLVSYPGGKRGGYTIPDGVTTIGEGAFTGTSLTSVTIPASVTKIGGYAFFGLSLTDVYYGGSEAQWKAIGMENGNDGLYSGDIHYNSATEPTDPTKVFTDLSPTGFYLDAVAWAVDKNITTGTTPTTFSPKDNCTHGHILTFLWRAAGEPVSNVTLPFETTGKEYYLGAAKWAYEKGMIGADFNHKTPCTRADAVNYIWQAFGKQSASYDGRFTDISSGSPYAAAVAWALDTGVTTGATATTFNPNGICNRGQIVTFLHRAYSK